MNHSTELIHRINSNFNHIIGSLETMNRNIEDTSYCREVIGELMLKKKNFEELLVELKEILQERR